MGWGHSISICLLFFCHHQLVIAAVASSRRSVSQGAAREKKNRGERKRKNGFFRFLTPRFPALFFRTEPQLTEHLEESIAAVS